MKTEVELLVEKVLEVELNFYDNPNGGYEYTCPFCGAIKIIGGREAEPTMNTIKHELDCAYLIAKSLNTK
jgi:hypothetical protein